jgi:hypothetical protein
VTAAVNPVGRSVVDVKVLSSSASVPGPLVSAEPSHLDAAAMTDDDHRVNLRSCQNLSSAAVLATSVLFGVAVLFIVGCAHGPPKATASGCARARLAREWHDATTRPFAGCWQSDALPGLVVLSERSAVIDDDADQPPTFAMDGAAVVERPTLRAWELLGQGLARLTWSTGFSGVTACVEPAGDDRLVGELRLFTDTSPLPSSPSPVSFVRVPCPAS